MTLSPDAGLSPKALTTRVKGLARELGFGPVGICRAGDMPEHRGRLQEWLGKGYHGGMSYLARDAVLRTDPEKHLPGCRSILVVALNYFTDRPPDAGSPPRPPGDAAATGRIARYALGEDYHTVIKSRLRELVDRMRGLVPGLRARICVDDSPFLDRAAAEAAGVGWYGKHSVLIHPEHGSWFLIGMVMLDVELEPDAPVPDQCGSCTRCIDACPTKAIVADGVVDSNRCISYLTIEHRGPIDPALHAPMGDWVFGCDICQEVCPWNQAATPSEDPAVRPRPGRVQPSLIELARLSQEEYARRFKGSAIKRAKRTGLVRNALIALGNRPDPDAEPVVDSLRDDADPGIREAARATGRRLRPEGRR